MLTLQIAIPTHTPAGIDRVALLLLPPAEGVGYVVSWQDHRGAPIPAVVADRRDVEVLRFDGAGLSANRNNAMDHCRADIILIGDDDLEYDAEAIERVRRLFTDRPGLEYASLRYSGPDNKPYPAGERSVNPVPRGFSQTTFEIALRRDSAAGRLRFSPLFGPGAPFLTAGEDEYFLLTAAAAGIACRHIPIVIARHPGLTSGALPRFPAGLTRTMGAITAARCPGLGWVPRLPVMAWRLWRQRKAPYFRALRDMWQGAVYLRRRGG